MQARGWFITCVEAAQTDWPLRHGEIDFESSLLASHFSQHHVAMSAQCILTPVRVLLSLLSERASSWSQRQR